MALELAETVGRRNLGDDSPKVTFEGDGIKVETTAKKLKEVADKISGQNSNNVVESAIESASEPKNCFLCKNPGANQKGFCLKCIQSDVQFLVPHESKFEANYTDILDAPELKEIGKKLIEHFDEDFNFIQGAEIVYLWKKKGGKSGGKDKLGSCRKPSGELKFFSEADFLVVLGADNCEGLNHYQITALVYHELKHAGWNSEKGDYEIVSHDLEAFGREVEVFGDWKHDVARMRRAFNRSEQLTLFSK